MSRDTELTRRIFEAMPGGIVHVTRDGSIERANPEALRILGLGYDELTGRYTRDFDAETIWEDGSPCRDEDYPVTKAIVTGERQGPATIGVRRPDGATSWAVFNAVPVTGEESGEVEGAIVTFIDITDRKRTEAEREELQRRLVLADRMASIGTLAAGVAHEINNPLTYVLTNLQLLAAELAEDTGEGGRLHGRLRDAQEGLERIRNVVRDLNIFSHAEEDSNTVDVHEVLESALRMAASELRYRARVARSYGTVPAVAGNASRLGQVFLNLLINAGQAIPAGNVDANEIRVSTGTCEGGRVVIAIADSGCGIPEELRARIFEPFVTSKPAGEGTGLGLYVCHGIITAMGGELSACSSSDGTVFRVTLPPSDQQDSWARGSDPSLVVPSHADRSLRVLVVDDEPGILNVFERALEHHSVTLATSGRQALHEIEEREFDVIFCDLIMPDVTGMDVYETITTKFPDVCERVVFMSGGAFTDRARAFVEGLDRPMLDKPFDEGDLERIIASRAQKG